MNLPEPNPHPDPQLKGKRHGNCNRTACQNPGATFYNTATRAYYCQPCAWEINKASRQHGDDVLCRED